MDVKETEAGATTETERQRDRDGTRMCAGKEVCGCVRECEREIEKRERGREDEQVMSNAILFSRLNGDLNAARFARSCPAAE
jgi:hypothetical protein